MRINLYVAISLFVVFIFIIPIFSILSLRKNKKLLKILAIIYCILYFSALFIGTISTIKFWNNEIIISIRFNNTWFSPSFEIFGLGTINLIANLSMFFPLGFITIALCKNYIFVKTIIFAFLLSLLIETYQLILPIHRCTELGDIILNTLSGLISAGFFLGIQKIVSSKKK